MAVSPLLGNNGEPVSLAIKSNGAKIADSIEVLAVTVRSEMNRVPEATIVIRDGDAAEQAFPQADAATFVPGAAITIEAGYGDATLATVFEGVVVALRLRIDGDAEGRLEVTCRHKAFKLTLGRRNRVHADMTDSAALASLVQEAGLTADVTATTTSHTGLVQYRCSDWDFLLARAEASGMLVCPSAGKIAVAPPDYTPAPALSLTYGVDIIAFDAEIDARAQVASVAVTGWDIASLAVATGAAASGTGSGWGNLTSATLADVGGLATAGIESAVPLSATELEAIAKARQARAALGMVRGRVRFQGSALAVPGVMVELNGLGARFSGKALACSVVHRIEDGDWITETGLGLDPDWLSDRRSLDPPAAAGLTAPARGLQIGTVTKLTEDPSAQNLIQVTLPLLGGDAAPVWARLGGVYASSGAGVRFLPEIGDEVVIGFFNDDPSHAVVLGSLHSASKAPPMAATAENFVKAIVTPKALKVEFDDDKKKLTLSTPGGNSVTLDDDAKSVKLADQNGNTITLASAGITVKSAGDITLSASRSVKIDAQADASIAGLNVTATGQSTFSASGNASAELKASGALKIQGALVQIN